MEGTESGESLKPLQPYISNPSQSLDFSGCLELQGQFVRVVHTVATSMVFKNIGVKQVRLDGDCAKQRTVQEIKDKRQEDC